MELLVAMSVGVIVMLALLGLADASLRGSTGVTRRADAAQRARPALDQMNQLLRSAVCIKNGTTSTTLPVVSATDTAVSFYAQVASGTATGTDAFQPVLYTITFTDDTTSGTQNGSFAVDKQIGNYVAGTPSTYYPLTDYVAGHAGVSAPTTRLLVKGARKTGATPVFRYYAYDASGNLDPYSGATALTTPLSATDLAKVAMVRITFSEK